jgi:hypothetical protein
MEDGNRITATRVENWCLDSEVSTIILFLCDAMALGRQQASHLELFNLWFSIILAECVMVYTCMLHLHKTIEYRYVVIAYLCWQWHLELQTWTYQLLI